MKNFSYQRQPSVLRTLKEPPKKNKKFNLDRALFIGILCFLAFLLIRYLILKLAFIQVDGQISLEKLNVNFTNDIRIKTLIALEGEAVNKGDTLFSYVNNTFDETALIERQIKGQNRLNADYDALYFKVKDLQLELASTNRQEELLKQEFEKVSRLVLLDLMSKQQLQKAKIDLEAMGLKIWELEQQLLLSQNRLANIEQERSKGKLIDGSGLRTSLSYYIAPISGLIGQINFSPNEVCYETQSVMTIHNTEKVAIKAYFNQEALPDIVRGSQVEIQFPDGSSSQGFISNLSIATYELPTEFQKKYEPTQRSLLATVEPQQTQDLDLWKRFYKMNVKVSINLLY